VPFVTVYSSSFGNRLYGSAPTLLRRLLDDQVQVLFADEGGEAEGVGVNAVDAAKDAPGGCDGNSLLRFR
jgi:hypothetical protein